MRLEVDSRVHLTELRPDDTEAVVSCLADRGIYENTLAIPFPYTAEDARAFLASSIARDHLEGHTLGFAVRGADGTLAGAVGLDGYEAGHRAQLGYWLARRLWGQGIMTAVVKRLARHAFDDIGLVRLTSHVFASNLASARVLEKAGFEREGLLRRHYRKDGRLLDALAYGLLRDP